MLDVPKHLYEAADIEGANAWDKLRHITLPMISPAIFFVGRDRCDLRLPVLHRGVRGRRRGLRLVGPGNRVGLGYPQGSTLFYTIWLYQQGFEAFHFGYASAMAWVLFIIVMICTLIVIRTSRRWVFYQGGFR